MTGEWQTRADREREERARLASLRESGDALVQPWGRDDDRLMREADRHLEAAGDRAHALRRAPGGGSPKQVHACDEYLRRSHALVTGLQKRHDLGGMSRLERHRALDALDRLTDLARSLPPIRKTRPAARDGSPSLSSPSPRARELLEVTPTTAEHRLRDVIARVGDLDRPAGLIDLAAEVGPLVAVGLVDVVDARERLVSAAEAAGLHRRIDAGPDALCQTVEDYVRAGLIQGHESVSRHDVMAVRQAREGRQ